MIIKKQHRLNTYRRLKLTNPIRAKVHNAIIFMITRCYNKKTKSYKRYGGRGIAVSDFIRNNRVLATDILLERLKEDAKRANIHWSKLSIDRIDNDGDYCLSNLRWATKKEQSNNRDRENFIKGRSGLNHYLFKGHYVAPCGTKFITAKEAAKFAGVSASSIAHYCGLSKENKYKCKHGWSFEPTMDSVRKSVRSQKDNNE